MILSGSQTVAVTNTARALTPGTRTPASWVIVQARLANANRMAVGGSNCDATAGSEVGVVLDGGESVTLPEAGAGATYIDLQHVFINGTAPQGVSFTYGRR